MFQSSLLIVKNVKDGMKREENKTGKYFRTGRYGRFNDSFKNEKEKIETL